MLSESEQWPFFAFRGFYHRMSCESNRCEPAMEPRQVFSACSVPPDASDSGKLLASPPNATAQASFGRVKEINCWHDLGNTEWRKHCPHML